MDQATCIFFDGISGSGKSATSQLIYLDLRRKGVDVRWYYEHAAPHPIVSSQEIESALRENLPPQHAAQLALERVAAFVQQQKNSGRVYLFESCLYQMFAGCLFRMDQSEDAIHRAVRRFEEGFAPLAPALVYFYQPDVGAALRRIAEKRGEGFDQYLLDQFSQTPYGKARNISTFDALIGAYVEFRRITDALYEASPFQKISIDTAPGDWQAVLNALSQFISNTGYLGPAPPARPLADYAGEYQETQTGHRWSLAADETGLVFDDAHRMKALPCDGDVFLLESAPIELQFEVGQNGRIASLRCEGSVLNEPLVGTVWNKVK